MTEQPLDFKSSIGILRRRRVPVACLGALGLCGGIAYGLLRPPMPGAVALVILPPSTATANGAPTRDMRTEIAIAESDGVLSRAGDLVSPHLGPEEVLRRVTISAMSNDVLSIEARASRPGDAEALANGIAQGYIAYVDALGGSATGDAIASLETQSSLLTKQVQDLQNQIQTVSTRLQSEVPTSAAGQTDLSLLGSLRNQQADDSIQLDQLNSQIAQARFGGGVIAGSTRVLQHASTVVPGSSFRLPFQCAIGLAAGVLVSSLAVLLDGRRDRRLRRRDEIATAVGASVVASLTGRGSSTAEDWSKLLWHSPPPPVEAWNLRRILRFTERSSSNPAPSRATVLSFAGDGAALEVGPRLAAYGASLGMSSFIAPSLHPALSSLRAACAVPSARDSLQNPSLADNGQVAPSQQRPALVVQIAALDRDRPVLAPGSGGSAMLAISSGFATADDMARAALAAIDAGQPIDGIVLLNPEPGDTTTGVLGGSVERTLPRSPARARDDASEQHLQAHRAAGAPATGWPE